MRQSGQVLSSSCHCLTSCLPLQLLLLPHCRHNSIAAHTAAI